MRGGWKPAHVILGGWPKNTKKDIIEAEAAKFFATLPQGPRELCLRPYCPRKFGEFAKMKVVPKRLPEVQLRIAQILEKRSKADRPTWSAIERSPEEGMRRRGVKEML